MPLCAASGNLFAATDRQVDWTADKLKSFGVRYLVGAHCTGIESLYGLRERIGLTRQTAVVGAAGADLVWRGQAVAADFTLGEGVHAGRIAR